VTLTRREAIAAKALQGLLAGEVLVPDEMSEDEAATFVARAALRLADSLIAELDKSPRAPPSHGKELAGDPAAPGSTDEGSSVSGSRDATPPASEPPGPGKFTICESCVGVGQRQAPPDWTWRVCDTCSGSGKTRAA
jgi:hypothetical protein